MRTRERAAVRCIAAAIAVLSLLTGTFSARAQPTEEQAVEFGVPRRQVVTGLDVEFECSVLATAEAVTVLDSGDAFTSIGAAPGRCTITLYILDVAVPVPILNLTPLGRLGISVPGVAGITLGLADVSIDLWTSLSANTTATPLLTPNPTEMAWSQWGTKSVTMSAHAGGEGNSLVVAIPVTFRMTLAIGVSVLVLGVPVPGLTFSLVDVGAFEGTPAVGIPVTIDLRPSRVSTIDGWAPSADAVQVNWTANEDSDFASYRVRLEGGASSFVFLVDGQSSSTLTMPAARGTDYTVSVTVVDRAGQESAARSFDVRTPGTSAASPPASSLDPILLAFAAVAAFLVGFAIAWAVRGRRAK